MIMVRLHSHDQISKAYVTHETPYQVHADSSNFAHGASKREMYTQLLTSAKALFADQRNWVLDPA